MGMKLLSVTIPCYNSQDYMAHAIESLLPGGDEVEILIVDDGSTDATARIADEYAKRYPGIVKAIHKPNGGHGDAVMTGLANATGLYFKVVDSDDWVDAEAYPKVLDVLRSFSFQSCMDGEKNLGQRTLLKEDNQSILSKANDKNINAIHASERNQQPIDMLICNYVYDKAGSRHKHSMSFHHTLPQNRVFGWDAAGRFRKGQYLLMHSVIHRTQLLRECGLRLPKHTFYVDELFVYVPLKSVERMYYLDVDFYHYFIGRKGQSVQEEVMIRRIDQALLVNKLLISEVDPYHSRDTVTDKYLLVPERTRLAQKHRQQYMINYLEIVTTTTMVLLTKNGTREDMRKKQELWDFMAQENPCLYKELRSRILGWLLRLPGKTGKPILISGYKISQKIFGFN